MARKNFAFDLNAPIRRITNDAILHSLGDFVRALKSKALTISSYDAWPRKICTAATVSKRFGSWRAALKQVGICGGVPAREYSPEELMDNLERVWSELGYPPGKRRLGKYGERISERPYINRWGSVRKACQLLAHYKQGRVTEEQLLGQKPTAGRRTLPLRIRWDVLKRGNYMCTKCGARPPQVTLEIDHIVPLAQGGSDAYDNLQILCNRCNQGKKARAE